MKDPAWGGGGGGGEQTTVIMKAIEAGKEKQVK